MNDYVLRRPGRTRCELTCVLSVVGDPTRAVADAARVLAPHGEIWIVGKFY